MAQERYEKSAACYQFDAELAAYFEGEDWPRVTAHARECSFCRTVLADLELIRSLSGQLPLEEPRPALWANIRAHLASEGILRKPTSTWQRWFEGLGALSRPAPAAALACLVIFAAVLVIPPADSNWQQSSRSLSAPEKVTVASAVVASNQERDLERTVRDVENNYQAHEASLEPTVKATYRKSLASLDASIRECHASVERDPSNTLAHEYLLAAYAEKAQVLTTALEYDTR